MITNYNVNTETNEVTVTYNSETIIIPPSILDGITYPVSEEECLELVVGIKKGEAQVVTNTTADIKYEAEYDNNQYARDRASAYPSQNDQNDMAYWDRQNGTTTLDDAITAVKATYPKP